MSERWVKVRILIVAVLLGFLFVIVLGKAYQIQTYQAKDLHERAKRMYSRDHTFPGARGTIFDREKRELAVTLSVDSIFADPQLLPEDPKERKAIAGVIHDILQVDQTVLEKRFLSKKRFVWIKRFAYPNEVEAVRELKIPGIDTIPEYRRFYPNRELASHLLGFMNRGGVAEGLELRFDSFLSGSTGNIPVLSDAIGKKIFQKGTVAPASLEGNSLLLSLSSQLQYIAERELKKAIEKTGAKAGTIVITQPFTGEILALSNWPMFNPNQPGSSPADLRRNRAITDPFEPGSTLKSFVYAAGVNENLIKPEEKVDCSRGKFPIGRQTIHDAHPVGKTTWAGALAKSSNICAYHLGAKLGRERLYEYLSAFGFGKQTGVEVPGESSGILRSPEKWKEINLATISFGHGITVTALQQAIAMGAIANGGMLMKPLLVKQVLGPDGDSRKEFSPQIVSHPISKQTSETLVEMLLNVTRPGGSAQRAALADYAVAGKTGTAQKVVDGTYQPGHFISSFVGFAPAKNPRVVVVVVLDEPVGEHYGGQIAAPVFAAIVEEGLRAMGVAAEPDELNQSKMLSSPSLPEEPQTLASSLPIFPFPTSLPRWEERQSETIPDFRGLTVADALKLARAHALEIRIEGSGIAISQTPLPGEEADTVTIIFDKEQNASFTNTP